MRYLVIIFIALIPVEGIFLFGGFGSLARVGGVVVGVMWLASLAVRGRLRRWPPTLWLYGLIIAFGAISLAWSLDPRAGVSRLLTYSQLLLMAAICWDVLREAGDVRLGIAALVAGSLLAAGAIVTNSLRGATLYGVNGRYGLMGVDANEIAVTIAVTVPFAWYLAEQQGRRAWRLAGRLVVVPLALACLLTASRTGLVALGVASAALLGMGTATRLRKGVAIAAALCVIGAGLWATLPLEVAARLVNLEGDLTTLNNRTPFWAAAVRAWVGSPVIGRGLGSASEVVVPVLGRETAIHNTFLSVLVDLGGVGAILAGGLCVLLVCEWRRLEVGAKWAWAGALGAWAVGCSTLTLDHRKITWLLPVLIVTQVAAAKAGEPMDSDGLGARGRASASYRTGSSRMIK